MHDYGTTEDQLGAVAVSCRRHSQLTPGAVMHDRPLTLDAYRSSPYLVEPFRREDCCLISDGGGAYVMTSTARARDLRRPVVEVARIGSGHVQDTRTHWAQQGDFTATPQVYAAPAAFHMAGIDPDDVDVYACYDPFTIVTLMQIEDSGFCREGRRRSVRGRGRPGLRPRPAADEHARRALVACIRARHRSCGRARPAAPG